MTKATTLKTKKLGIKKVVTSVKTVLKGKDHDDVKRDIILFAGFPGASALGKVRRSIEGTGLRIGVIFNKEKYSRSELPKTQSELADILIPCDITSDTSIKQSIQPHHYELLAITCRSEGNIPFFQKVIPHVPYLKTPTTESLEWTTNKILMRKNLKIHDKKITPKFSVVKDSKKKTIKEIESKVGFPLIIKPSGLAASMLVTMAYHPEELEDVLKKIFRKLNKVHREQGGRGVPQVLVEQLMEGDMYSTDVHVTARGRVYFNPFVEVITGKQIGFDDFFGYRRMTPTRLSKSSIDEAEKVAKKAIHALGLRSCTSHVELMKTEEGWKIIELGPRIGGFRQDMYNLSYGTNIAMNDIYIRIPQNLEIKKKIQGYTAVFQFFARKEGIITKLIGTKKAKELDSFVKIDVKQKIGDRAVFARNGGKSVFNIILFNKTRSKLLADIRRLEKSVKIGTKNNRK
jgi:hypothetical protein